MSSSAATTKQDDEQVVLVIGACGLDRLLTVSKYPNAEEKIRTQAYHEVGGGNASNTSTAMALLSTASFLQASPIRIKLLTKLGDDSVGRHLVQKLDEHGVDLSSPLFCIGPEGSTTSFTTVIVSIAEQTRTCIHTPGTCGELSLKDLENVGMDQVFENVVHLHSDCRHVDVAFALAREAKSRGIAVSVDAEKDRLSESMDGLLETATTLFTNSSQLESYFRRRRKELGIENSSVTVPSVLSKDVSEHLVPLYSSAIEPSSFFEQFHKNPSDEKDVVITKGSRGSIHVATIDQRSISANNSESDEFIRVVERLADANGRSDREYKIQTAGVLENVDIVDTTGAGDAYIGGYILCRICGGESVPLAMKFGAWVGGRKLSGPGAQTALPKGKEVDEALGMTRKEVEHSLEPLIGRFR